MALSNFSVFASPGRPYGTGKLPPGYSVLGQLGHHYDPNEPRVAAGHPDGGQWTRELRGGAETAPRTSHRSNLGAQYAANNNVVSDAPTQWQQGAQYAADDSDGETADPSHSGVGPNERHRKGVEAAIRDYLQRGYSVIHDGPVAVDVPGFRTPRFYDFVVRDPVSRAYIGVEVKTTLYDMIWLNEAQVARDVMVVRSGGVIRKSGLQVRGVGCTTYCWGCEEFPDIRKMALQEALKRANIPFQHGGRPS